MTKHDLDLRKDFFTHKYDGLMLFVGGYEIRTKFEPTVEVFDEGVVWEVKEGRGGLLKRVRVRPGKPGVSQQAAMSRIKAQIPTSYVLPVLRSRDLPDSLYPQQDYSIRASSKVVFIGAGSKLSFIREGHKRLDFIGGQLEPGETPMDCAIREVSEETGASLVSTDLVYLGETKEEADTIVWTSHFFLAVTPASFLQESFIETYYVDKFSEFKHSPQGRPRQVWVASHLDFLHSMLQDTAQAWCLAVMALKQQPLSPMRPNSFVQSKGRSLYHSHIRSLVHSGPPELFFQEQTWESVLLSLKALEKKGYLIDALVVSYLKQEWTAESDVDLDFSPSDWVCPVVPLDVRHLLQKGLPVGEASVPFLRLIFVPKSKTVSWSELVRRIKLVAHPVVFTRAKVGVWIDMMEKMKMIIVLNLMGKQVVLSAKAREMV